MTPVPRSKTKKMKTTHVPAVAQQDQNDWPKVKAEGEFRN